MNKEIRIKKSTEFEDIIKTGKILRNSFFNIYYKDKVLDSSRFGITLSKNFGNSVVRNRYKRVLREIVRNNQKKFKKEFDYIIIMKKSNLDFEYKVIEKNLLALLQEEK